MKGLIGDRRPCLGAPLMAVAAAAAVAGAAPAAEATFPGKRGPIAFQRIVDPRDEQSSQIFTVARPGARVRRLTRGGNGFDPDYSPDGRRIAFERRFGGVMPDTIFTMGADGSAEVRVTACAADPLPGLQRSGLVTRRKPACIRARVRTDRQGQRRSARSRDR